MGIVFSDIGARASAGMGVFLHSMLSVPPFCPADMKLFLYKSPDISSMVDAEDERVSDSRL